jgi:rhodanese-related sulfurtransferase
MSKQRPKNKPKTTTAAPSGAPRVSPMLLWAGFTLVILAAMGLYAFFGGRGGEDTTAVTPYPMEISVQEAAAKRDAGAFILDVREQFEWDDYHIPGATLIPLGELASRVSEIPDDQEIVVVCRSGNRSQDGRDILKAYGLEQVSSMAGGMLDWRSAGYPTE